MRKGHPGRGVLFLYKIRSLERYLALWNLYHWAALLYTIFRTIPGSKEGRRIKEAREKRHLTQEELAARIDISPTHVSVIERGTKIPRLDTFVAIANALEVSGDALLLDVVDHAAESQASDLSAALEGLPWEEKRRILKVVRTLMEE